MSHYGEEKSFESGIKLVRYSMCRCIPDSSDGHNLKVIASIPRECTLTQNIGKLLWTNVSAR